MAKRTWIAKMNCMMPFKDFAKGESVVLDDSEVTPRVKALFECKDIIEERDNDPDFKVIVARLKAAKIPIPRGANKDKVKELFKQFLVDGATAPAIAGEVTEDKVDEAKTEEDKVDEAKSETKEETAEASGDGK